MLLKYTPNRYEEFVTGCVRYLFSEEGRKLAEHEAAHFNKLIELGCRPTHYVIILTNSSDPLLEGASIDFDEDKVSARELAIAALAPRDVSVRDLRTASKVFSRQERRLIWENNRKQEAIA
jgi:hypothetical protein